MHYVHVPDFIFTWKTLMEISIDIFDEQLALQLVTVQAVYLQIPFSHRTALRIKKTFQQKLKGAPKI